MGQLGFYPWLTCFPRLPAVGACSIIELYVRTPCREQTRKCNKRTCGRFTDFGIYVYGFQKVQYGDFQHISASSNWKTLAFARLSSPMLAYAPLYRKYSITHIFGPTDALKAHSFTPLECVNPIKLLQPLAAMYALLIEMKIVKTIH